MAEQGKYEFRMRWVYREGVVDVEGFVKTMPLGNEERAARVQWEHERAKFIARDGGGRLVFEERKFMPWVEMDDTTPEYARDALEADDASTT